MAKWDAEIIAALESAGRTMGTNEIVEAIGVGWPHEQYTVVHNAVMTAARRGVITRLSRGCYISNNAELMSRSSVTKRSQYSAEQIQAAQRYVNDMLAIMEKYGSSSQLTPERYGQVVRDVLKAMPPAGHVEEDQ